ncbi:MAG TPA: histidine phosphatase family protein [Xanthomonadaceae bacterium]|nr:histidine phosphatase family protein [Xanthomonadaceae bacterium]
MRTLILLRHASAEPLAAGQADADRSLSERGRHEAEASGRWLAEHELLPERTVCSPSARTRQTAELAGAGLGGLDVVEDARIYEATPGELIRVIDAHADCGRLLLVGHNPGIEQLLALLTEGASDAGRGLPTSGVAVLDFDGGTAVEPGCAQLVAYWRPE